MVSPDLPGVAIVGMAGRFPGAAGIDQLWENLVGGVESISRFSLAELEARDAGPRRGDVPYVAARGIVDGVELFDAGFFGVNPKEAELMDPQHRIFLECCWEALEDAGHDPARARGSIGVFAGQSLNTYLLANLCRDRAFIDQLTGEYQVGSYPVVLGNDKDYLATRVSYKLDLGGPSITVQCACSTSLVAVCQAVQSVLSFGCDMALAGGVSITFPQKRGYLYQEGGMVSPDGSCRTFDADAQGTVFSSGAGVVLLKRVEDAVADGDHIYAVIRGTALNNDGARKVGYTAPSIERQAEVIALAQAMAGVEPRSIGFVETHGTGTPLGDPIEVTALTRAFRTGTDEKGFCALGAVKTNLGHLEVAAGVTGLIKAALSLDRELIPPTLHFEKPNPRLELENSPFYVNTTKSPWPRATVPRRAGVSAFGVGGTNAHVVLEEAPVPAPRADSRAVQLLTISARSAEALETATARLAAHLENDPSADPGDVSFTLQEGRRAFAHRRVLVAKDCAEAAAALRKRDTRRLLSSEHAGDAPRVVFLFPGQGAQSAGMGAELYASERVFREIVDECCERLTPHLGDDLRALVFTASPRAEAEALLADTRITQPALFVFEYALASLWRSWGVQPAAMLGHSIGEYVAACLAGVFTLHDALDLVAARGQMIASLPRGAMLAARMPREELLPLLQDGLDLAADNGPSLCVVSGPDDRVAALETELTGRGATHRRLRTSHAFHSSMMDPMLARFEARVARTALGAPAIPFVSCVTGKWITPAEATDPAYWARHVRRTVRFGPAVQEARRDGAAVLLEVGPGKTLTQLARQSCPPAEQKRVFPSAGEMPDATELGGVVEAMGRLWLHGVQPDWLAFRGGRGRRVRLPTYPFERKRYWIEPRPAAGGEAAAAEGVHRAAANGNGMAASAFADDVDRIVQAQLDLMAQQLAALAAEPPPTE